MLILARMKSKNIIAGTWEVKIQTPLGERTGILELRSSRGKLSGDLFSQAGSIDLDDLSHQDGKLSWTIAVEDPVKLNIRAEAIIDGDRLSGTVHLGAFGERGFSGERKIT